MAASDKGGGASAAAARGSDAGAGASPVGAGAEGGRSALGAEPPAGRRWPMEVGRWSRARFAPAGRLAAAARAPPVSKEPSWSRLQLCRLVDQASKGRCRPTNDTRQPFTRSQEAEEDQRGHLHPALNCREALVSLKTMTHERREKGCQGRAGQGVSQAAPLSRYNAASLAAAPR